MPGEGKKRKAAFSMAELLLCLTVSVVIAAFTFPFICKVFPNKHESMLKKSCYLSERIVSELINDDTSKEGVYTDPDRFTITLMADGTVKPGAIGAEWTIEGCSTDCGTCKEKGDCCADLECDDDTEYPDLPDNEKIVSSMDVSTLRKTKVKGIYCQQVADDGTYHNQKHYYYNEEYDIWIELAGVYHTSNLSDTYLKKSVYSGEDADKIGNNFHYSW